MQPVGRLTEARRKLGLLPLLTERPTTVARTMAAVTYLSADARSAALALNDSRHGDIYPEEIGDGSAAALWTHHEHLSLLRLGNNCLLDGFLIAGGQIAEAHRDEGDQRSDRIANLAGDRSLIVYNIWSKQQPKNLPMTGSRCLPGRVVAAFGVEKPA